ncbi:MAG: AMP-binding protein [Muribaculaceae bacterium]|nr:AMP-binding protein [Muribaculaceae bacterium]
MSDFLVEWCDGSTHVRAHTSGSTGCPKEIMLAKSDMRCSAVATNAFFGIGHGSVLATPLSADYIAGKMMAVRAFLAGAELLELPVSNEVRISRTVDLLAVVPSQLPSLLNDPECAAKVRNLLIGGAAPSAEVCRRISEAGFNAFISYGMTETCSHVALARASDPDRVFHAMPGISFSCDDRSCLVIEAPGYSFGTLTTNDVVRLLDNTSFQWRGRADGVINSGGLKFFPEELEALYAPALEGIEYFVTAVTDPKWGQAVCLIVEGCILGIEERIRKLGIDRQRVPKRIISVKALRRTANGKIDRSSKAIAEILS